MLPRLLQIISLALGTNSWVFAREGRRGLGEARATGVKVAAKTYISTMKCQQHSCRALISVIASVCSYASRIRALARLSGVTRFEVEAC